MATDLGQQMVPQQSAKTPHDVAQPGGLQAPCSQTSSGAQATPQPPQFSWSLYVLEQAPSQHWWFGCASQPLHAPPEPAPPPPFAPAPLVEAPDPPAPELGLPEVEPSAA